ncbi:MAG: hypothetical protein LBE12_09905 [Planctomycetaceae bacterium]|jgi:hypothetical protein|nr:hypothetical protein [Planctomycetaceae bacterium]
MKFLNIAAVLLLSSVFVTGCTCYSGYYYHAKKNLNQPYQQQIITDCQEDYSCQNPAASYNPYYNYQTYPLNNCSNCIANLLNSVFVLGEGAFCLAASPFIIAGNIISNACGNYESFQSPCCSNEVYYGDNCYQQDICNPCSRSDYYSSSQLNNCSNCNNPNYETNSQQINNSPISNYKNSNQFTTTKSYRSPLFSQMNYQQIIPQRVAPPQRMTPPRPQVLQNIQEENNQSQ